MDREEQIEQAAKKFVWGYHPAIERMCRESFISGGKWADEHPKPLCHDAQGDYLPPIDKEVIVIDNRGKVSYGHRPNPEGWDGRNIVTDEVTHYTPQTYDKGGWNIPNLKYWLDVELPNIDFIWQQVESK